MNEDIIQIKKSQQQLVVKYTRTKKQASSIKYKKKKTPKMVKKSFTNQEVADLLRSVAAAYELQGEDRFRVVAYEKAADSIEHASSELKDLWDDGKLTDIPGIGASIAQHLDELFRTGKVRHFDEVMVKLPQAMFTLMKIRGIGVKTAFRLSREFNLANPNTAAQDLLKHAQSNEVAVLEGFGEKSQQELVENIRSHLDRHNEPVRMLLPTADRLARQILAYLKKIREVKQADTLGSLRRQVATVGDIDLAVATDQPEKVLDHFVAFPGSVKTVERGPAGTTIELADGTQIDLRVHPPGSYGSLLQHFTGSKNHNIKLREMALKKGWSLSEWGVKYQESRSKYKGEENTQRLKDPNIQNKVESSKKNSQDEVRKFRTEKEFYEFLKMQWIPPEIREDTGEIEVSLAGKLPHLVELTDIKGDLHCHSDFPIEPSHDLGDSSIEEMALEAEKLGYEYLGLSEHNPSVSRHSEDAIVKIVKKKQAAINRFNASGKSNVKILNGLEIDIQPEGQLALPEQAFNYLDYAIASIHSSFQMSRGSMTKRVLRALEHPKVKIFGHPTGRKLNYREGIELDWDEIFAYCKKHGKILEVSAWPDRLDLPDHLVREAVKERVKIVVDSDAHRAEDLNIMRYGVAVARRGWAEKPDIINTLSYDKMIKVIS